MDDFIGQLGRFLSNTVVVHVYSYPHFAIEALLATVVCVAHALLIHEVNALVGRVNARAAGKLRLRHTVQEVDSYCSYHRSVTAFPGRYSAAARAYAPYRACPAAGALGPARYASRHRPHAPTHLGWAIRGADSALRGAFDDRVERLLATTPSEYVRRDKDRKSREVGLRSCIQSLTSMLERALDGDRLDLEDEDSKEAMRRSINAIRETFESRVSAGDGYDLARFPSVSLQNLIAQSSAKRALETSLGPEGRRPAVAYPVTDVYLKERRRADDDDDAQSRGDSADTTESLGIAGRSRDDLDELFGQEEAADAAAPPDGRCSAPCLDLQLEY